MNSEVYRLITSNAFLGNVPATATKHRQLKTFTDERCNRPVHRCENTQLINKKLLEARYLDLLKKGTKMADLLEIESTVKRK
jgi:hypothetical protein